MRFLTELYPTVGKDLADLLTELTSNPDAKASQELLTAVAAEPTPLRRYYDTNTDWVKSPAKSWACDDAAVFNGKLLERALLSKPSFWPTK